MGEWKDNIFMGCFQNFALSCTICLLAPLAVYKNAEKVSQPGVPWMFTAWGCGGAFLRHAIDGEKVVKYNVFEIQNKKTRLIFHLNCTIH